MSLASVEVSPATLAHFLFDLDCPIVAGEKLLSALGLESCWISFFFLQRFCSLHLFASYLGNMRGIEYAKIRGNVHVMCLKVSPLYQMS